MKTDEESRELPAWRGRLLRLGDLGGSGILAAGRRRIKVPHGQERKRPSSVWEFGG